MLRALFSTALLLYGLTTLGSVTAQPTDKNPAEAVLNHFLCYRIKETKFGPLPLSLQDQFSEKPLPRVVTLRRLLCNPASKKEEGKEDPHAPSAGDAHLVCYMIPNDPLDAQVRVTNQLYRKEQPLRLFTERYLCVPSGKQLIRDEENPPQEPPPIPTDIDHFKCYSFKRAPTRLGTYLVKDQLDDDDHKIPISGLRAAFLCNPVDKEKNGEPPTRRIHDFAHLVCYDFNYHASDVRSATVRIANQLETPNSNLHIRGPDYLCIPSTKVWRQPHPPSRRVRP